ncbi:MAG: alkaline phosphatase family protein [Rhodospirillaceae bacterium]|nr:alkaline phosphatase family protein [Rhodospirillaceae bacterium]
MSSANLNLLFITADQWRADCLGVLGHPVVKTPNLDALAADATLFGRHYTQAVPCGPARACLHTGRYLMTHRSVGNGTPLDDRFGNWAREVRKAGYDPTLYGYTDTSADPRRLAGDDPLLHTYEGLLPGITPGLWVQEDMAPWRAWLAAEGFGRFAGMHDVYRPRGRTPDRGATFDPPVYDAAHSDTAYMVDQALAWLSVRRDTRWCLHLSLLRPHPPWVAPEPYNAMYDAAAVPAPVRAASRAEQAAQHPFVAWLLDHLPRRSFFPDGDGPVSRAGETDQRQARATYYGLMTEVDHHLGRVFAFLKDSGQWEHTLVVFTSDHGEQLGDHHLYGKLSPYDPAFHIPLMVRAPGHGAGRGRRVDAFTEAVDVAPTILDALGLEVPQEMDGCSLVEFLAGGTPAGWRQDVFWECDFRDPETLAAETALGLTPDQCSFSVLRDRAGKYVHFTALPPLFFDLEADPGERENLAERPEMAATVLGYAQRLLSRRQLHAERTLVNHRLGPAGPTVWKGPRR